MFLLELSQYPKCLQPFVFQGEPAGCMCHECNQFQFLFQYYIIKSSKKQGFQHLSQYTGKNFYFTKYLVYRSIISPNLTRTRSAADTSHTGTPPPTYKEITSNPIASSTIMEDPLPPPPPPIYFGDAKKDVTRVRITRDIRDDLVSRSTTSAASVTLTSGSSRTGDSEDEESRKKVNIEVNIYNVVLFKIVF